MLNYCISIETARIKNPKAYIISMINDAIYSELFAESEKLKNDAKALPKKRFLYEELAKRTGVMCGIYGLRGTGKTTLLLQLSNSKPNSLYINAENLAFRASGIRETVEFAAKKGIMHFFIDEVHAMPDWPIQLKLLYDLGIREIYFSGSSAIKIQEKAADLSRRALLLHLPPLSFREFLGLSLNVKLDRVLLEDVLDFGRRKEIITSIAPYAGYFQEYMKFGSFPFYLSQKENAYSLYTNIIEKMVRVDLAGVSRVDANYIETVYKAMGVLTLSGPNEVSRNSLSNAVGRNAYTVETILRGLCDVGMLNPVKPFKKGVALLRKEPKYLMSPPLRLTMGMSYGATYEQLVGAIREDIFVSNAMALNPRYIKTDRESKTPGYMLGEKSFELGAHRYKHGTDYYVKDQLIIEENVIPLPLFCLFY